MKRMLGYLKIQEVTFLKEDLRRLREEQGFTIVELALLIVILGILFLLALPKFIDLQDEARLAAEEGVVGAIRSGISIYYADQCSQGSCEYPDELDGAASSLCTQSNPCFDEVLQQGGVRDGSWSKIDSLSYASPSGQTYVYDNATGKFEVP